MFPGGLNVLMDAAMRGNSTMFQFLIRECSADKDRRSAMGRSVADYIRMDHEGKSSHDKTLMGRLLYVDFLMKVSTGV